LRKENTLSVDLLDQKKDSWGYKSGVWNGKDRAPKEEEKGVLRHVLHIISLPTPNLVGIPRQTQTRK
jgi:hypothetical protein